MKEGYILVLNEKIYFSVFEFCAEHDDFTW